MTNDERQSDMKRHTTSYMKKRSLRLLAMGAASVLALSSCSDFLEIEPRNEIVLEGFWTEKADVDGIVAGCYSGLQSDACVRRMILWGEGRSEDLVPGQNSTDDGNLVNLLNENIMATNAYTTWVDFYNVINRCNTVLKYAPQVAEKDPAYTESELNATRAEMVGLRSLCYFYLIRTFRDVPYSTVAYIDDDQEMALPATPFDQVLDSLITDLESVRDLAVKRYPTNKPLYQTSRITQDVINAMLCEMYLWKKDYARCIQYADLVIESKRALSEEINSARGSDGRSSSNSSERLARTNGFPLVNDMVNNGVFGNTFTQLFAMDNTSPNAQALQEIIFQLSYDDDPRSNSMIANSAVARFYGTANFGQGYLKPSDYIVEDISKTSGRTIFEDKNKTMDARLYENINTSSTNAIIGKYVYRSFNLTASGTTVNSTFSGLWPDYYIGRDWHSASGANWIIYRLSDIMLLKAEALTQQLREGTEQETLAYNAPIIAQAFYLVNAVNKRSILQTTMTDTLVAGDYSTKAQMEELVLRERHRELMFEGKRWYDLVRLSRRVGNTTTLTQAALQKVSTGSSLIQNKLSKMDAIYLPYNNDEMKVNPFLVQNPAFSSGENSSYK